MSLAISTHTPACDIDMPRKINPGAVCSKFAVGECTMLDVTKPQAYNAYDAPHADIREFLARIEAAGELLRVPGAHWDLEMGTLAEIVYHTRPEPPAILFEEVPGYPKG